MTSKRLNAKKKIGFILFAVVLLCWIAVPILPFFDFPYKALIITSILITGEILFVLTISLLGKEYWNRFKHRVLSHFSRKKVDFTDNEITNK